MRIGFVSITDAANVTAWSGIPFQIMKQMQAQKVDVQFLSPLNSKAKYLLAPVKLAAKARGQSITLDHFRPVLRDYAAQIDRFVRDRAIDVVFSTSTIPITLLKCRRPIVTWTDAVFHAMKNYYGKSFANLSQHAVKRGMWQEKTALDNCAIAVFASTWALDGARELTDARKLRVLPFGSSLPIRHSTEQIANLAAEKRSTRKRKCELLFVGVNWKRKGGDIAVETARLLNEAGVETRLRIVGSQPEGEVPPFVDVLGFINKSSEDGMRQLTELYETADFFILPTQAEAAGIVFCEASSFGLPSITYATGGVPDYVRDRVNGICMEPGSPAERFAGEIERLLANPAEYESYAAAGFREYQERLNWETSVRRLVELCKECTGV
jgi:glycosyltransferase involved in cell wall biosynthesis